MPIPIPIKENKIFIDNFPKQSMRLNLKNYDTDEERVVITGFNTNMNHKETRKKVISEIFKALLLHDKIVVTTSDVLDMERAFGLQDTISLIQTNRFEFVDDKGLSLILGEESENKYSLSDIRFAHESGRIINSVEWVESKLFDNKIIDVSLANRLLLNIEKHNKEIDVDLIHDKIIKETQYDLKNTNVSNYLNMSSESLDNIKQNDIYNLLRLSNLNKTLVYSSMLGIDNMVMEGGIKQITNVKFSPSIKTSLSIDLFDSIFQDVFNKKDIPDLAELYIREIITLDDYLEILSTWNSKKFRKWIMENDYNPSELEADIMRLNPKISNNFIKFIRWTIPNAMGIISPPAGLISSAIDSFLVEKILEGWHPNFFLDNLLKQQIDSKIKLHESHERIKAIKSRFPNINRNDSCPCGSKIKFKKCCGK